MKDEVWLCGGQATRNYEMYDDTTRTCKILSLVDGNWKTLESMMVQSRINPVMFVEGSKVFVISGFTSHPNSETGCRATQEVGIQLLLNFRSLNDMNYIVAPPLFPCTKF